jgi:hypothetical protein
VEDANVVAVKQQIDIMTKVVGKERKPMTFAPFLVGHETEGWSAARKAEYLKEHGKLPVGDNAAAERSAYCKAWFDTKAGLERQQQIDQEFENYLVCFVC